MNDLISPCQCFKLTRSPHQLPMSSEFRMQYKLHSLEFSIGNPNSDADAAS